MSLVPVNVVPQLSDQMWTNDVLHLSSMAVKLGMVVIVCLWYMCVCVVCVCEGGVCV